MRRVNIYRVTCVECGLDARIILPEEGVISDALVDAGESAHGAIPLPYRCGAPTLRFSVVERGVWFHDHDHREPVLPTTSAVATGRRFYEEK